MLAYFKLPTDFALDRFSGRNELILPTLKLFSIFFAATMLTMPPSPAADFTITDGQTVTSSQILDTDETGIVEEGGTIITGPDAAIEINAGATGVRIVNRGTIRTTQDTYA
ncbi:MAG: hypothetical protein ACR2OW_04635, partial [Methyloligellaceae bacterium]